MKSAGKILIVDGYVSDPDRVFSAEHLTLLLEKLAKTLDMLIIYGPVIKDVPLDPAVLQMSQKTGVFADDGGISIFCMISTSHISLHAWPLQRKYSADIFSCKDFDHTRALNLLSKHLGSKHEQVTVLNRQFTDPL